MSALVWLPSPQTPFSYHGMYKPVDPSVPSRLNPELTEKLVSLRSGGNTHFDDALDKAIDFFQEAPIDRRNIMIFYRMAFRMSLGMVTTKIQCK
jgi:hypothetical protein